MKLKKRLLSAGIAAALVLQTLATVCWAEEALPGPTLPPAEQTEETAVEDIPTADPTATPTAEPTAAPESQPSPQPSAAPANADPGTTESAPAQSPVQPSNAASGNYQPDYSQPGAMNWDVALDGGITSELTAVEGGVTASAFKGHAIDLNSPMITDGAVEFTVNMSSEAGFAVIFRAEDQQNLSYIAFEYGTGSDPMVLQERVNNTNEDKKLDVVGHLDYGQDTRVRVEFRQNEVIVYKNGTEIARTETDRIAAGHIGFRIWDGWNRPAPDVTIKDVQVTSFDAYQPDYSQPGAMNWDVVLDGGITSELTAAEGGVAATAFKGHAIDLNSPVIADGAVEFTVNMSSEASFAVIFRAEDQKNLSYVAFDHGDGNVPMMLQDRVSGEEKNTSMGVVGHLDYGQDTRIRVEFCQNEVVVYKNGAEIARSQTERLQAGHIGFRVWDGWNRPAPNVVVKDVKVTTLSGPSGPTEDPLEPIEIGTGALTVQMDNRYPTVQQVSLNGSTVPLLTPQGRSVALDGTEYWISNLSVNKKDDNTIDYSLDVLDVPLSQEMPEDPASCAVRARVNLRFTVQDTNLRMDVLKIEECDGKIIHTIAFPGMYMGGVRNHDEFDGAAAQVTQLTASYGGISEKSVSLKNSPNSTTVCSYAVVYDDQIAVTSESNIIETMQKVSTKAITNDNGQRMALANGSWVWRAPGNNEFWGTEELPWAVATFAQDENEDGTVDWQDGAIRFRDIAVRPYGWEDVADQVSHIFMNCASGASQPFMRQLDSIKTLYYLYDGFGQFILEKGYNGEGHDDALYDLVGHVNERAGGEEDFQYLLSRAKDFNARIGVHVNVNEYTLDSWYLDDQYLFKPYQGGWGYLDQSYKNDSNREILDGAMAERMQELCDAYPDLAWVYIDIFNGIDWYADKMAECLNDNGIPVGTEYRGPMEKDMIWVHNSTDIHYPVSHGQDTPMYRMMKHTFGDIFPPHELLKNLQLPSVGAWEHTTDFNEAIRVFYNNNLAAKYMQQQNIMKISDTEVVFDQGLRTVKENREDLGLGERVNLYQDGKLIATLPTGNKRPTDTSDWNQWVNSKVFIPWYDEDSTTKNPLDADKIYFWDAFGGTTTWELPDSWADQTEVDLYRLTGAGRVFEKTVPVNEDGTVTLTTEAEIPYILHRAGDEVETVDQIDPQWGENTLVEEPGFNSMELNAWQTEGSAQPSMTSRGDADLLISAQGGSVSQTITGLQAGQNYTFSVWTDVRGDAEAVLTVQAGERTLTDRAGDTSGFVRQERNHKYGYTTYQQLRVNFTVPQGVTEAEITLSCAPASGDAYVRFDDVRVFQSLREVQRSEYTFFEDFENVPENFGPFLYATPGYQSIEQVHLASKNPDPDHPQLKNYVVDGLFSLKMNNNSLSNARILRTVPSSLKLEPNTEYELGLDYYTAKGGTYQFSVKNGQDQTLDGAVVVLDAVQPGETGHAGFTFTTDDSEDCYVEVYQIGGIGDIEVDYLSIDNFYIDQLNTEYGAGELNDLLAQAEAIPADGWTAESYAALADACAGADELLCTTGCVIDADALKDAMQALQKAMDGLEKEKELDGISIRSLPDKTVYRTGEALDLTGGVILAEYSDGTSSEIPMITSMVSGFDSSKTGVQTLEVLYCGKTAQFEIEVLAETTPTPEPTEVPEPTETPAPTEVPGPDPDPSATPAPTQAPDTGSETDGNTAIPQTGDTVPLAILVLALALCTGTAGLIVCKNKHRSK